MPAFTTNQWAILLLVLLLGWLLGLASRSGGKRWRAKYESERADHAAYRKTMDARIATAEGRVAELERQPIVTPVAGAVAGAGAARYAASDTRDDLTLIRGVDATLAASLHDIGVRGFHDVETFTADDQAAIEGRLKLPAGVIARERWPEQAALLRTGRTEEWRSTFG